MKHLLLLLALYLSGNNASAQCDPSTFVFSISPGITQSGFHLSLEGGIWPITGRFGGMLGVLMYDEKIVTAKGSETLTQIDAMARGIYKLTPTDATFPQVLTAFVTARGVYGASYRAYMSIGEYEMVGIEPVISRLGAGVNILITMRL